MFKFRDLTIMEISPDKLMVISCDSAGGIGNKYNDVVQVEPEVLGFYTTQGPLMELLAQGAKPICIVDNLGVEMNNTGEELLKGIKKALEPLNLEEDLLITGSTEENISVSQTFMGITIIGTIEKSKWRSKRPKNGNILVLMGIPLVGHELVDYEGNTFNTGILLKLLDKPYVKDIIPVGSKGIEHEIGVLASTNNLKYELKDRISIDIKKSAGPSTCGIIAMDEEYFDELKGQLDIPMNIIGTLTN